MAGPSLWRMRARSPSPCEGARGKETSTPAIGFTGEDPDTRPGLRCVVVRRRSCVSRSSLVGSSSFVWRQRPVLSDPRRDGDRPRGAVPE